MTHFDVIIIGGGASGLMCALAAGQRGRRVLVLDSSNKVGKKILMSGGGRCNFTNLHIEPACFLSANSQFCISALNRYTQWDFIALVEKHGIAFHERKHGQLFCNDSSKAILGMLISECERANVTICVLCETDKVEVMNTSTGNSGGQRKRFKLATNKGDFTAESLVIASGGLSIPTMGATSFAYDIARQFGLNVLPTRAGLVPFMFTEPFKAVASRLSGVAIAVDLWNDQQSFRENVLFTHRGLSGPAVLQLSNYWHPGETVCMNLFPDEDMPTWLKKQKNRHPRSLLRTLLSDRLTRSLAQELQGLLWPMHAEMAIGEIPDRVLETVGTHLNGWSLKPSGTEGYRTAEVTLGGVDTTAFSSKTMECRTQTGLYFIGEAMDVTGWLGGYNFQWAWSSGYTAGQFV
ncbi:NAD(P)/FAD-dependent oxidoreductase [Immundisolibacter sp.]|uniref:NAD(P)/FAD-dependent oxidoreductase n=1 Tax=Immundisolibacter sp. TaxID=1934948 RepID=UPI0035615932